MTIDGMNLYNTSITSSGKTAKTAQLQNQLSGLNEKNDKELMEACKNFEAYFLEQVFKSMEKTVMKSEESSSSEYTDYFQDMLRQEYANNATEHGGYGIAQMLYESMKRN